jgi:hypothetical protein
MKKIPRNDRQHVVAHGLLNAARISAHPNVHEIFIKIMEIFIKIIQEQ